jgi:hypothetical protein
MRRANLARSSRSPRRPRSCRRMKPPAVPTEVRRVWRAGTLCRQRPRPRSACLSEHRATISGRECQRVRNWRSPDDPAAPRQRMTRFARFRSGGANRGRRPSGTTVQIRFCSSGLAYLNRDTLAHGSVQHLALSSRQARRELSANSWSAIQRLVRHPRAAIDLSHTTVLTPDLRAWRVAFRQISVGEVEYPSSPRRTLARRFLRKNAPIAGRRSNGTSGSAKPRRSTR